MLLAGGVLLVLIYIAFFPRRFGVWPEWNLPLGGLLGFWLVGSYVIGRYFDAAEMRSAAAIKQAIRTLITLMLSIGLFLAWLWLTASPSLVETSCGFMMPMLLVFALSRGLLQHGVNRLLEGRFSNRELWLVLGRRPSNASCSRSWAGAACRPFCSRWISAITPGLIPAREAPLVWWWNPSTACSSSRFRPCSIGRPAA